MTQQETEVQRCQSIGVALAVMTLEPHGGVADQVTNLALELPKYGVLPVVLVRNPLASGHGYVAMLRNAGVRVMAIQDEQYRAARNACRFLSWIALPIAVVDSAIHHKTLAASQHTIWGVLRRLGYAGLDLLFGFWLLYFRLGRGFQLVHFRKPDSWPWIGRARRFGMATIYTEDTIPWDHTLKYYQGLSAVASSVNVATAVSQASADALGPYLPMHQPIRVIPNVVSTGSSAPIHRCIEHDHFVVGHISRLDPQKDLVTLLLAARRTAGQDRAVQFHVFGNGPLRNDLELLTRDLGLSDHVKFRGAFVKADLAKIMAEIDVVALSSHYEGFGVVLAEGMAFAKPVVATKVGGVPNVVEHGITGILVPPRDPEALAAAILTLSGDPERYQCMANAARERYLAYFTPERVVPQYVALYKRLIP